MVRVTYGPPEIRPGRPVAEMWHREFVVTRDFATGRKVGWWNWIAGPPPLGSKRAEGIFPMVGSPRP